MIISSLLGVGLLLLCSLVVFAFRGDLLALMTPATQTEASPTLFIPTPDCGTPTLVIGSTSYQIQTITPSADGSLTVPADTSGIAYWVDGTNTNYVFLLSATSDNLALLSSLPAGSTAMATWKDCNSTSYNLLVPETGSIHASTLPDQSLNGITIFIPSDPSGNGSLVKGELAGEQISTFNTPSTSEIQAEIGVLETTTSADGTTIRIGISIYNWGGSAFTLSSSNISLTQPDGTALTIVGSEPPLPKEIAPASTETIYFTFPRPATQAATLKILTVEYDIEGY
jgi:hypothetical protein